METERLMTDDKKQPEPEQQETTPAADAGDPEAKKEPEAKAANDDAPAEKETPEKPDPIAVLTAENNDLRDRYVRLAAEMENLRKRTAREKADMAKYAISDFARDVLTISDNFQRAISAVSPEAAENDETLRGFLDGVEMNERELQKVLERHGVSKLDPKGEKFDPNMHQAVQQVDNPDLPNNTVCDVYQVGYMIADRVLRHAVVAVAKGGPKASTATPAEDTKTPEDAPDSKAEKSSEKASGKAEDVGSTVDKNV
jgi:molecular chaperone GrpE